MALRYPVSKATLARDLQRLVKQGYLVALGKGPNRTYRSVIAHPLIALVYLDHYFARESDQRTEAKTRFSPDIFEKLPGVISPSERERLARDFRSFTATIEALDPTLYERELERFIVELSWKSSKIEGNTYSLLETEMLLTQNRQAAGKTREEAAMLLNHKQAFQVTVEHRRQFQHLSLSSVMQLHNALTKELSITSGIRKQAVGITGTVYRPLDNEWQIREALAALIDTVNAIAYPLEKALVAGCMIAYIQPFTDGNKRTARMLSNAILMAHDHFPLSYRSVSETEYKQALILFYETNNLYHVKRLFLEQYRFALETYFI